MKISNLFKIHNKKNTCVNEFFIGNNRFVIIEVLTKKNKIIKDQMLTFLLTSSLDVMWFNSYYEMESNINYFPSEDTLNTKFIIIG